MGDSKIIIEWFEGISHLWNLLIRTMVMQDMIFYKNLLMILKFHTFFKNSTKKIVFYQNKIFLWLKVPLSIRSSSIGGNF